MCINSQMWIILNKCFIYTSSGKFLNITEPICCTINELSHRVKTTHSWAAFKGRQLWMKTQCSQLIDTDSVEENLYRGWLYYKLIVELFISEIVIHMQGLSNVLIDNEYIYSSWITFNVFFICFYVIDKVEHICEVEWKL